MGRVDGRAFPLAESTRLVETGLYCLVVVLFDCAICIPDCVIWRECSYSSVCICIQPEMQAQTTLINFTVTRDGLEEQLLAAVVAKERPDLEKLKASLTHQQNQFKITLKSLEDSLLARLSTAEGNFLGDYDLVENLETTKRTAMEIEEKVKEAKLTETKINEAREAYRPVAVRASLLYFVLNDLNKIHPMYQFSLKVR